MRVLDNATSGSALVSTVYFRHQKRNNHCRFDMLFTESADKETESTVNVFNAFDKGKSNAMVDIRACNKPVERVSKYFFINVIHTLFLAEAELCLSVFFVFMCCGDKTFIIFYSLLYFS